MKRQEVEAYMAHRQIDILCIQETHMDTSKECRERYTWYFSGDGSCKTIAHGVGIVIRNELRNYVTDVVTVDERNIAITMHGKVDFHVISTYAPTAEAADADKDKYYNFIQTLITRHKRNGITIAAGDYNAKLNTPGTVIGSGVGHVIFGAGHDGREAPGVDDNRQLLQQLFIRTGTLAANTFYVKTPDKLAAYIHDKAAATKLPLTKPTFEVVDYILIHQRWRNAIKDINSDTAAGIDSDHYPLVADVKVSLKAQYMPRITKTRYFPCTEAQAEQLNERLAGSSKAVFIANNKNITQWIKTAAEEIMTKKTQEKRAFDIPDETQLVESDMDIRDQ